MSSENEETPIESAAESAELPDPAPSAVPKARPGKKGGRRDVNRRERTRALLGAATQLFLERGIEATTIDDITKEAGVAKGSFYRYFESKTHLVEMLYAPLRDALGDAFQLAGAALISARDGESMHTAYVALGQSLGQLIWENLEATQLYLQENRGPRTEARAPVRDLADLIAQGAIVLTEKARTHGLLRDFPAEVSALVVVGAIERLLFAVLIEEAIENPIEIPDQLTSLILDGLRAKDR